MNSIESSQLLPPLLPPLQDAQLTLDHGVATLTFDRHDLRNALTGSALVDDIIATVDWINATVEQEGAARVLILTGAGSAFSAGGNVKDIAEQRGDFAGSPEQLAENYRKGIQRMPLAMQSLAVPAIAAVNGPAIGAGFDLANMCDIRLASSKARFGETFVNLGLSPGDGGAWYLQRLIGYQRAAELTFTGRIISADEALEYGIVLEVLEPEQLMARAQALAADIASKPAYAQRMSKLLMQEAQTAPLDEFLERCGEVQGACHHTPDHQQAMQKILDDIASRRK